ncbi:hypothetical protein A3D78_00515 [Candidatus Gottesmanbacteria bacterium RIFCSPHIGHO2_02_FULL_39_14]|nr:MAG: hypothetical protein A3D78_00515 [Candidatus Gottesmanbacteria bacterium RIFCSPHIGHO2_02_FULL_39_14]
MLTFNSSVNKAKTLEEEGTEMVKMPEEEKMTVDQPLQSEEPTVIPEKKTRTPKKTTPSLEK